MTSAWISHGRAAMPRVGLVTVTPKPNDTFVHIADVVANRPTEPVPDGEAAERQLHSPQS